MVRHFHKHRLLLDENFPARTELPRLNGLYDLKHVRDDFKEAGLPDPKVYQLAVKHERILITFNAKDFIKLAGTQPDKGIIGISTSLSKEQIDKKLTALLVRCTPNALSGKFFSLTGETEA
jgi:predicted nuclease of predicted toxin-antitoxin system